jgi:hypothetical protein
MSTDHKLRMAENQVARLRSFYDAGKEMLARDQQGAPGVREELAQKYSLACPRLTGARRFALQYSELEFADLAALRKPDGNALHVGYIPFLLTLPWQTVEERRVRAAWQQKAASNGWTAPGLAAEIKSRTQNQTLPAATRRRCGRPRKPKRLEVLAKEIEALIGNLQSQIQQLLANGSPIPAEASELARRLELDTGGKQIGTQTPKAA